MYQNLLLSEAHPFVKTISKKPSLKKILILTYLNFLRLTVHPHQCSSYNLRPFAMFISQIFSSHNSIHYPQVISTIYTCLVIVSQHTSSQ